MLGNIFFEDFPIKTISDSSKKYIPQFNISDFMTVDLSGKNGGHKVRSTVKLLNIRTPEKLL